MTTLKYKNCCTNLIFFQRYNDTQVKVNSNHEWTFQASEGFFKNRKINMCKASHPSVYIRVPERDKRPLGEIITEYKAHSAEISKATFVDPRRIGSLQDTAMYVFQEQLKHINLPKATTQEGTWLHYAHRGGVQWADKGYRGPAWKYDVTSFYPSLCHSERLFPTGKTVKTFLPSDPVDLDLSEPAIYRVEMIGSHPLLKLRPMDNKDKLTQSFVYATNLDLQSARDLKVEFRLVEHDTKWPNCLKFEKCTKGHFLFGKYVDRFFPMKKNGAKSGKYMLNVLTGMLVQKERVHHVGAGVVDVTNMLVQSMIPGKITYLSPRNQIFRHPDKARLGVFITAYGRRRMVELLLQHDALNDLVRIHTDGFHLKNPLPTECTENSAELGGLKLEHEGNIHVEHVNKVHTL